MEESFCCNHTGWRVTPKTHCISLIPSHQHSTKSHQTCGEITQPCCPEEHSHRGAARKPQL